MSKKCTSLRVASFFFGYFNFAVRPNNTEPKPHPDTFTRTQKATRKTTHTHTLATLAAVTWALPKILERDRGCNKVIKRVFVSSSHLRFVNLTIGKIRVSCSIHLSHYHFFSYISSNIVHFHNDVHLRMHLSLTRKMKFICIQFESVINSIEQNLNFLVSSTILNGNFFEWKKRLGWSISSGKDDEKKVQNKHISMDVKQSISYTCTYTTNSKCTFYSN